MATYQAQATAPNLVPEYSRRGLHPAIDDLTGGDLYVSIVAHTGRAEVLTNWMDPSVTDENDPLSVDPALDPFSLDRQPPVR